MFWFLGSEVLAPCSVGSKAQTAKRQAVAEKNCSAFDYHDAQRAKRAMERRHQGQEHVLSGHPQPSTSYSGVPPNCPFNYDLSRN